MTSAFFAAARLLSEYSGSGKRASKLLVPGPIGVGDTYAGLHYIRDTGVSLLSFGTRWTMIVEFADHRSDRGSYCNIQDGFSGIMPVFSKHDQRKVVCFVAVGICNVSETRSDDDKLAFCRSLQNQNVINLHVGPTESLDAFRSWSGGHGPTDEVVSERERLVIFQAPRTGMGRDAQSVAMKPIAMDSLPRCPRHSYVSFLFQAAE